jgi:hypothetical protein
MLKKIKALFLVCTIVTPLTFASRVDSRPNLSLLDGNYKPTSSLKKDANFLALKSLLSSLSRENQLLAYELGKLPEFMDSIDDEEVQAIKILAGFYSNHSNQFDNTFSKMYAVGKPEIRKYCSSLQALFWMILDGKIKQAEAIIMHYDLNQLLSQAWGSEPEPQDNYRTKDFKIVVGRLSSPELIDYYTKHNFTYYLAGFVKKDTPASAIFYNRKGACYEYSLFIHHCLVKAGYKAFIYNNPGPPHKIVGYVDKDNKWYVLDNGRKFGPGGIIGPYGSESELRIAHQCQRYF